MKKIALTIIAAILATNAFATEIPKRVQQRIIAAAPENFCFEIMKLGERVKESP
jgi:hypothetical protein